MSQMSFSNVEYSGKCKKTRHERFLVEMVQVLSWNGFLTLIDPYYSEAGGGRSMRLQCARLAMKDGGRMDVIIEKWVQNLPLIGAFG
ncbi:hypothetical protein D3C76_199200 [compost metagenome]